MTLNVADGLDAGGASTGDGDLQEDGELFSLKFPSAIGWERGAEGRVRD